jgi:hypothetical protein
MSKSYSVIINIVPHQMADAWTSYADPMPYDDKATAVAVANAIARFHGGNSHVEVKNEAGIVVYQTTYSKE